MTGSVASRLRLSRPIRKTCLRPIRKNYGRRPPRRSGGFAKTLLPGEVVLVPAEGCDGRPHGISYTGWTPRAALCTGGSWSFTVLKGVKPDASAYLVHTSAAELAEQRHRLAECDHDGVRLTAALGMGPLTACRFNPEKSGRPALSVLGTFWNGQ